MQTSQGQFEVAGTAIPSWLLSVVGHIFLIFLFALMVRPPQARGLREGDRGVGITLAQPQADSFEYFDQVDSLGGDESITSDEPSQAVEQLLPNADQLDDLVGLDIALPGSDASLPTDQLFPDLEYSPLRRAGTPSAADVLAARQEAVAARQRRAGQGPATEISLFDSAPAVGNSFIFVLDRSDSMGRRGLGVIARAKNEFRTSLENLQAVHRFQIVAYNHQLAYFTSTKELVSATEQNKRLIDKFMGGLAAFGATNHFSALSSALNRGPDVIFLLTDGGEPTLSAGQMVQLVRKARQRTTIHCIQFGRRPSDGEDNFMRRLAAETGGSYRYLNVSQATE